jgi:fatty acid desaturase
MRAFLAYTGLRLLVFAVAVVLLWLVGARGLLLLALAVLISGIASIVLLSRQRDALSSSMVSRWRRINDRIDASARREDENPEDDVPR